MSRKSLKGRDLTKVRLKMNNRTKCKEAPHWPRQRRGEPTALPTGRDSEGSTLVYARRQKGGDISSQKTKGGEKTRVTQ